MNQILSTLTGEQVNDTSKIIIQGWTVSEKAVTGYVINTRKVFSVCEGTVLAVERDPKNDGWSITVEIDSQTWVRYCKLSSFKVDAGQEIKAGDFLGYAYREKTRFEYCNAQPSQFPVRISNRQLYKHDPSPIIFGMINLVETF